MPSNYFQKTFWMILVCVLPLLTGQAVAATFAVTKTADTNDGTCNADCSLREAVAAANAAAGTDTITVPAGLYPISLGTLTISGSCTLQGAGAGATIMDGGDASRIFLINSSITVVMNDMTLQHGQAPAGTSGGAIFSGGTLTLNHCRILDSTAPIAGGGILVNMGSLTVNNSTISGNTSTGGAGGGGIFNAASLTITNSTISGNMAPGGGGIASGGTSMTLTNTTLSGNSALTQRGGGFHIFAGTATLNNVTITNNHAAVSGGGIANDAAVNMTNTILAGNTGVSFPDCNGTALNSGGSNLIEDSSCPVSGDLTGNISGAAKMGALANNGGATFTHALLATSPAIDAGNSDTCASEDQREHGRPQGANCDIGAFEFACPIWGRSDSPDVLPDAIVIDPANSLVLYAAAAGTGILKSTDGGSAWSLANTGLSGLAVRGIAVDPQNSSIVYAGVQGTVRIYKSTDAGDSWTPSDVGVTGLVSTIVIDPTNTSVLYASSFVLGVNKSTDSGVSWSLKNSGITAPVSRVAMHPTTASTLYAATTSGGVFRTTDSGANWAPVNTGITDLRIEALASDLTNPNTIYAATHSGVFRSTDAGDSWATTSDALAGEVQSLAVDPVSGIVYAGSLNGGVFRSIDGGQSWLRQNTGLLGLSNFSDPYRVTALAVGPDGIPHAGVGSGIFTFNFPTMYCDDFEDGDAEDWTFSKGIWSVLDGNLQGTFVKKADNLSPSPSCDNCVIETDLTIDSPLARASLLGWFADKKNLVEIVFMDDKNKVLLKQKAGGVTVAKGKLPMAVNPGQTYHLRVEFAGNQFHVAIDGVPVFDVPTGVTPLGGAGVRVKSTTGLNATASYGEIVMYSLL